MTYLSNTLYVYGGFDPASNVTFGDLWGFDTVGRTWCVLPTVCQNAIVSTLNTVPVHAPRCHNPPPPRLASQ